MNPSINPEDKPTHYEVLEIAPDATSAQIREAYLRVKSTYGKDSVALYTLIDPHEREEMLRQIEEAYLTLSDEEKRKNYDSCHGFLDSRERQPSPFGIPAKVISIDRTPPMSSSPEDLLVPPITAYERGSTTAAFGRTEDPHIRHDLLTNRDLSVVDDPFSLATATTQNAGAQASPGGQTAISPSVQSVAQPASKMEEEIFRSETVPVPVPPRPDSKYPDLPGDLSAELETQTEWPGTLLRRVREARRISVEEMANITKVSKTYLFAIEEENFAKLPAPVFVRGFVHQVARTLKLPANDVVNAYMGRLNKHRPESKK